MARKVEKYIPGFEIYFTANGSGKGFRFFFRSCGSGSALILVGFIRIHEGKSKLEKYEEISYSKVLDVLF
jgi:hypothetical protein